MSGKLNAARMALELVKDGMVLGIGSGTTVELFLKLLGDRIREEGLEIYGVPSSYSSHIVAVESGVKIVDLIEHPEPELCIDGADQVDAEMNCIKGGGAAMTREKVVAAASRKVVIIVDESKVAEKLTKPVPIEVLPFAYGFVVRELSKLGRPKLRTGSGKFGPVITDNGNFVVDCEMEIGDAAEMETALNSIPGVVENGIFPAKMIDAVIVGSGVSARRIEKD